MHEFRQYGNTYFYISIIFKFQLTKMLIFTKQIHFYANFLKQLIEYTLIKI